jgi:hypothetical protein
MFPIGTAGTYRLRVMPINPVDGASIGQTVPDHFTRAYTLTASQ